jgi:predicted transcriptional regulator of viral defense system
MQYEKNRLNVNEESSSSELFSIAFTQAGLFTAKQASVCGYALQNHHYHVKRGHWIRQIRGIYQLSLIPASAETEYWLWYLWSRDREDNPQGVFSHFTALSLHGLSDVNPEKIDMSVPKNFRKGSEIPEILQLHKLDLSENDVQTINGLKVMTPLKTLIQLAIEGKTSDEILEAGVKEALGRGMIIRDDLKKNSILARYAL